jgi:hypothetical protein
MIRFHDRLEEQNFDEYKKKIERTLKGATASYMGSKQEKHQNKKYKK